jgi:cellulose biosynthesis protein BcsQ
MSLRVAVLNNKGGVGKTFVTLGLAEAAARAGQRVLVVDMDPQANATRRLGAKPEPGATLTRCLRPGVEKAAASDYIVPCGWGASGWASNIAVLCADLDLEDRNLEAGVPGASSRLQRALFNADNAFDLTVIDCPPSIKGHLTGMAVGSLNGVTDTVLVPVTPESDAMGGARRAVDFVRVYGELLGVPQLAVSGMVVNAVRAGVALHEFRQRELLEMIDEVGVLASVPLRARIAEVQDAALPLSSERDLMPILAEFEELVGKLLTRQVAS